MTKGFLGSTALVFALAATPVWAQEAADDSDVGLADIVVTAQKRVEDGQKAPLAVTVLTAETLATAHITGAADLQRVIPNLNAQIGGGAGDPGGGSAVFTIRGLGASATGPQGSAGVAPHFDGVYRQDGISNSEFFDLERIEVDPGPQGTLYGRSAAAGAINIIPAKPDTSKTSGAASVSYGNYDALTTQGMFNLAISDQFALRAAFQTQKHDGYYSNGYDDQDSFSGRVQFLIKPSEDLSIRLATNFAKLRGVGAGNVFVGGPSLPNLLALLPNAGNPDLRQASVSDRCLVRGVLSSCIQDVRIDKTSVLAEINYDFGAAVLTLLPAWNKSSRQTFNANAPLPLSTYNQQPFDGKQFNFEGRVSSPADSAFKWVVGGNYFNNKVDTRVDQFINVIIPALPLPTPPFPPATFVRGVASSVAFQDQQSEQRSSAVFGQATYPVADAVRVTLGGRYNWDKSSGNQVLGNVTNLVFANTGFGPVAPGSVLRNLAITPTNPTGAPVITPGLPGSINFKAFTWKAAVDADIGPRSIVYASVGTGYKPGSLNDGGARSLSAGQPNFALAPEQFFGPEKVMHYELGTKNRFLGNTLQVNAVVYYSDYKNYQNGQTQVVNPLSNGALGFVVTNAGKARVYGTEVSVKWQASPNDLFDISANYLNAKFTSYIAPAFLGPNGPAPALNISGFRLPNAPRVSGNVSYQHTFDLGETGKLVASAFSHLTSGYYVYFAQADGTYQKGHTSSTLDLTWTSNSGQFAVSGFVSNLENKDIKVFGGTTAGYSQVGLAAPRTYGGKVAVKF
jgi:iron complex outermembrane recepter protein